MSAPLAGKFSDHYEVLGVDSKADIETIKDAYARLAAKFSPTNTATGDREKFDELNAAFEVLSDPHLRKAFDGVRSGGEEDNFSFPVQEFIDGLGADEGRRRCLLALLYYRRKSASISPGISMRQVEALMKITQEQLSFMVWVLKQQGLVSSDDKSRLLVTVSGIENIEAHKPTAAEIEPWLRSSAETVATVPVKATAEPVEEAKPAPVEKAPLREAPALTPQGMATAGLSSLRTALQKSMGPRPAGAPAPKPAEAPKTAVSGRP